jgi:RimJ/RimL family protein N-acetyltransferase
VAVAASGLVSSVSVGVPRVATCHNLAMQRANIKLEALSVDHLRDVMTWVNDREVMQYFAARQTEISEAEERAYIESLSSSANDRAFSIFDADEGGYVGQCSINKIYWPARNGRVFLVVCKAQQRKGYGRAALQALVEHAWQELDLHKLWLIVRRDNRAAQAMYLKLGFDFEGVLRDEYYVLDRYHDMVRMSMLRPSAAGTG